MKRLIAVLSGLLVLPAFAEVAPIYYDDVIEYSDMDVDDDYVEDERDADTAAASNVITSTPVTGARNNTGRTTASRAVAASGTRTTAPTRAVSARGTSTRNATSARTATSVSTASRATTARATVSRPSTTNSSTATNVASRRTTNTSAKAGTARAATNSSIVQTNTVSDPLYIGNSARVGMRTSGVSSRVPTIRMASSTASASTATVVSSDSATTDMDELAQVTDFCKAQYTQCMDNFCNVLDDNQGRCSCSANLKNYAATEAALKQATEDLQDVAQKIQYIGLSADDVETLFTQTEAELKMSNSSDNTQLKNDLDKIKSLIVDVKSGGATSSADSGISLDLSGLLDFTVSSTGFDLSSIFGTGTNTSSISNQRGEQLYKTATARCKASVLNTCASQGVDVSLITNSYDLEIDRQCIQYERNLNETNSQMTSTVRNAKSVLQKARLMVAQQKNTYDLRGCVNALDACMQDDFVCGSDYENCLDPTGKYIVNGKVVAGSAPGQVGTTSGVYATWGYDGKNAWSTGSLADYIDKSLVDTGTPTTNSSNLAAYLQAKIGWVVDDKNYGMCSSVLNKCQDLTYSTSGGKKTFNLTNSVTKEFLQRTLVQIKAKQDSVLEDYATSCVSDVVSCLSQNNYNFGSSYYSSGNSTLSDAAIRSCNSVIVSCMSVSGNSGTNNIANQKTWLTQVLSTSYPITADNCTAASVGGTWTNGVCTKRVLDITFTFSTSLNAWVAPANDVGCGGVTSATYDSASRQCISYSVPNGRGTSSEKVPLPDKDLGIDQGVIDENFTTIKLANGKEAEVIKIKALVKDSEGRATVVSVNESADKSLLNGYNYLGGDVYAYDGLLAFDLPEAEFHKLDVEKLTAAGYKKGECADGICTVAKEPLSSIE